MAFPKFIFKLMVLFTSNQLFNLNFILHIRQMIGFDIFFSKFFLGFYGKFRFYNINIFFLSLRRALFFIENIILNRGNFFIFYPDLINIYSNYFQFFSNLFLFNINSAKNGFLTNFLKHKLLKENFNNLFKNKFYTKINRFKKVHLIPSALLFICNFNHRDF